jgi:hypothetical protein
MFLLAWLYHDDCPCVNIESSSQPEAKYATVSAPLTTVSYQSYAYDSIDAFNEVIDALADSKMTGPVKYSETANVDFARDRYRWAAYLCKLLRSK